MKRVITAIFIALIIIAGIAAILPYAISSNTIRDKITGTLEDLTGRRVSFQDTPSLSYTPYLGIEISNLTIEDPSASEEMPPLLSVEKVKTKLKFSSLFLGKIEIDSYELLRPRVSLKVYSEGTQNWDFSKGKLQKAIKTNIQNRSDNKLTKPKQTIIGTYTIIDGIMEFEDEIDGTNETITNINGKISWADTNSNASIMGNGIWNGEGITTNTTIEAPLEVLSGGESPLTIELKSQPLEFKFTGQVNKLADLFFKGDLDANTPSIARLAKSLEIDVGDFQNFESLATSGQIEATVSNINLSDTTLQVGENQATGVLRLSKNELDKYKLDGTLAFDNIELKDYWTTKDDSQTDSFFPSPLKNLGVDIRISSNTINIGSIALAEVAAAIIVDNDGWVFDIGNSTTLEGSVIAKLGERKVQEKQQAFFDISAKDINAQSLNELFGKNLIGITGTTSFKADMRINKSDEGFASSTANGAFRGDFISGELLGIDLINLLQNPEGNDASNKTGFDENASTNFDTMNIKLFLNNGAATLSSTELISGDQKIRAIGDIDFKTANFNLQIQEITPEGPKQSRLFITGNTKSPSVILKDGPKSTN